MPFNSTRHELLTQIDELSEGASMLTTLSHRRFRTANTQEQRVIIPFDDEDGYQPLQREQFETLYERIHDGSGVLSMTNDGPNANGSQGFITLDAQPHPDGTHSAFEQVTDGIDIVRESDSAETDAQDRPIESVDIHR